MVLVGDDGRVHPLFYRPCRDRYGGLRLRQNPPSPPYRFPSPLTFQADHAAKQLRPPWGKAGGARASARQKIASALAWRARQSLVLRVMLHGVSTPLPGRKVANQARAWRREEQLQS